MAVGRAGWSAGPRRVATFVGRCSVVGRSAIAAVVAAILGLGCSLSGGCENSDLRQVPSPDERWMAWVFVRSCRAAPVHSMQVSILPASAAAPSEAGNVFVIEQASGVAAEWAEPEHLGITYERESVVLRKVTDTGEVTISYRAR